MEGREENRELLGRAGRRTGSCWVGQGEMVRLEKTLIYSQNMPNGGAKLVAAITEVSTTM